jgi:AcrR family transcriptional regulator
MLKANTLPKRKPKDTTTRRQPSQSRSRRSVAACLLAAQELLERDGIDGVTTKKIAQAAGLSVGAVYSYFPNKESIICQLGEQWMDGIRERIHNLHPERSAITDAFAYFDQTVDMAIGQYSSNIGLGTVINMLSAIPELREAERKHDRAVIDSFASAFGHFWPHVAAQEFQALARSILSMTHAALSDAIVRRNCDRELALRNLRLAGYSLISHVMALATHRKP